MLRWAERNLRVLDESQAAFHRKCPYSLWGDKDPATGEHRVRVSIAEFIEPPDDWVFQIGDIIHNMRVSLDYLAWAVIGKQRLQMSEREARAITFPIFNNPDDFTAAESGSLHGLTAETLVAFEAVQPYRPVFAMGRNPLPILHDLDKPHKHRHLLSAAPHVTAIDSAVKGVGAFNASSYGVEGAFIDGAVVARGTVVGNPREAKVEVYVVFEIAFDDSGPAPREPVLPFLKETANFIREGVFRVLEPLL